MHDVAHDGVEARAQTTLLNEEPIHHRIKIGVVSDIVNVAIDVVIRPTGFE
jgi:hypothetical protein